MKTVQVLLSTYNGEKYLKEQLDSIINQVGVNVRVLVRDDGSIDSTVNILEDYKKAGQLEYYSDNNIGYKRSFLELASNSVGKAEYYAFCDQDDYWEPEKLVSAIMMLEESPTKLFRLYFSNLRVVDENLNDIGFKDYSNMKLTLGSAMVRSSIAGCTMVFNNELLSAAVKTNFIEAGIISHDGWLHRLCLSIGGTVVYDTKSYIKYRQHGSNVTGVRQGIVKRVKKELDELFLEKGYRSLCAKIIINEYSEFISKDNLTLLTDIASYKESPSKTVRLLLNKDLRFGVLIIDLLMKLKIMIRSY